MAKARPAVLTALLSGAAVVGYVSYRLFVGVGPDAPEAPETIQLGEDPAAASADADADAPHLAERLPEFSLDNLAGTQQSITSWPGKPLLINFWATWCGPCRRWMPVVAKLEKETAGKGVKFFAVNLHEELADVREYVQAQKIEVPVLLDTDGAVGIAYGARSIPLTVVVGRDGKVVRTLVGVHPEDDLRDALRDAGVAGL
jgi:thiol-disulfide isomerase/thioredoxin